jgi:hypothetical protein
MQRQQRMVFGVVGLFIHASPLPAFVIGTQNITYPVSKAHIFIERHEAVLKEVFFGQSDVG